MPQCVAWRWALVAIHCIAGSGLAHAESGTISVWRYSSSTVGRDASPESANAGAHPLDDWDLTMRIRAALLADPELAGHNLVVVVRGGQVEVDGPVPNATLRQKVRQVIQSVPGVRQFRERLRIQANSWSQRILPRRVPPVDEPWPREWLVQEAAIPTWNHSVKSAAASGPGGFPVPWASQSPQMPTIWELRDNEPPFASVTAGDPQQTLALLERSLRQNWRFRHVHAQLADQTIRLQGSVATAQDLQDLYHLISRISGVVLIEADGVQVTPSVMPHTATIPQQQVPVPQPASAAHSP